MSNRIIFLAAYVPFALAFLSVLVWFHFKYKRNPPKEKKTPPTDDDNSHWNIPPHIE